MQSEEHKEPGEFGGPPPRAWLMGMRRGFRCRCPRCGEGKVFSRYIKVHPTCHQCGLELGAFRSEDGPPYFTIVVVGHVIIPGMLLLERLAHPPAWVHFSVWLPMTIGLSLYLLPRIKGAVIGTQWGLRIKG